ncbi:MAG: flagellar basal body-associated FliL family protein [Oleiphilaceae bacterium]|nr:flagellar basal body-associated FliL family protein [Oleiphilaceae bacterium]
MKPIVTQKIGRLTSLVLLLLALSVTSQAAEEKEEAGLADGSSYMDMTPAFVVNVQPEQREHISFLKAEVTLRLEDATQEETVEKHLPWLRHELVTLFSRQKLNEVQSASGQEKLRQEGLERLNQRLEQEAGEAMLKDLLFTTFVLQRR